MRSPARRSPAPAVPVTPERVRRRARALLFEHVEPAVFGPGDALEITAHHLRGEPISYAEALDRPYEPFVVGDAWGGTWDTTWFHLRGEIPAAWAGETVVLRFELAHLADGGLGGEGLVWRDGVPLCGMSPNHADALLTLSAQGGEPVDLYIEAAANPPLMSHWMSGAAWPLWQPDPDGQPNFRLARAELAVRRREVAALAADLRTAIGLAEQSADDERSREIHRALYLACAVLDPDDVAGTASVGRAALAEALGRGAASGAHRVTAVGHAHIDTAWLWPLRETVRKCARTFATAVSLMEEYPDYHFVCSAAQHLAWIEERYPALFARIAERVGTGQFEPVGGMWVEADCNLPSGESLVRQIVFGKRFFASRFGVDCRELWLPDAFGYTAALPQIMAQAGVDWFVSQKLSWNDTNPFPHHTFWWEGIDGTRVRAHFPPADTYCGDMSMAELFRSARQAGPLPGGARSLYPYGYGDGGGGPTRRMLEAARRAADLSGAPRVVLEPAAAFFAAVEADADPLPTWVGDLYLEKHRATFTSQAAIKAGNRRAEVALQAAELWSTAAAALRPDGAGPGYPAGELEEAWQLLLTNQFHDILPGSSIRWVAEQAGAELAEAAQVATEIAGRALAALAAQVEVAGMAEPAVVFNPTPFARREVVSSGGRTLVADVPPLGYAALDLATPDGSDLAHVEVGEGWMGNGHLVLRWDEEGRLVSIWDADHQREVLASGQAGNLFQLHEDRPADWDAWDVDRHYLHTSVDLSGPVEVEVTETGGLRGAVRFRRHFGAAGASTLDQRIVLSAGSRRIDFVTDVDWREDHKFLKVTFPVGIHSQRASFEIQFGHLERPTHENTAFEQARFEVPAQRWADLSESGYGVALLNDSKYGYDVHANVLRLSLLRAPTAPDPLCDRGQHRFTYSLLPHAGSLTGVIAAGYALNAPLVVVHPAPGTGAGPEAPLPARHSFVSVDDGSGDTPGPGPGFVVETLKRADDGVGVVVRGYEALGGHRKVRLRVGLPYTRAVRCDLLEREREDVPVEADGSLSLSLRPFELVSLRLFTVP